MALKPCLVCGTPTRGSRCPAHKLTGRPRGNAFEPTRMAVAARDGWTCALCGERIDPTLRRPHPRALHVDHETPRAHGGPDTPSNYRATHARCNLRKGTR